MVVPGIYCQICKVPLYLLIKFLISFSCYVHRNGLSLFNFSQFLKKKNNKSGHILSPVTSPFFLSKFRDISFDDQRRSDSLLLRVSLLTLILGVSLEPGSEWQQTDWVAARLLLC